MYILLLINRTEGHLITNNRYCICHVSNRLCEIIRTSVKEIASRNYRYNCNTYTMTRKESGSCKPSLNKYSISKQEGWYVTVSKSVWSIEAISSPVRYQANAWIYATVLFIGPWEQHSVRSGSKRNIFINKNGFEHVFFKNSTHFVQASIC